MPPVSYLRVRLVAIALVWVIFPGALQATENIAHLAQNGHLPHAAESGDSHSDPGPEHGCNGAFHICSCHLSAAGLLSASAPSLVAPDGVSQYRDGQASLGAGHQHNIEHPPRF
jgi:hypothetical protein